MKKNLLIGLAISSFLLAACQQQAAPYSDQTAPAVTPTTTQTTDDMQTKKPETGDTIAILDTDKGTIKFKLFPDLVPETAKNFITLAKAGKYDGVIFHRVIEGFMIQGGDFTNHNGTGGYSYKGPGTTIDDEFSSSLTNIKGAVAMANAGPNTNGSQFFIVTADQGAAFLNNKYSVFGQVFEGQDVADAISKVPRDFKDAPLTPITIKKITITTF